MTRLFDPKCHDLARYFLDGEGATNDQVDELAESIQAAVEDGLSAMAMPEAAEHAMAKSLESLVAIPQTAPTRELVTA